MPLTDADLAIEPCPCPDKALSVVDQRIANFEQSHALIYHIQIGEVLCVRCGCIWPYPDNSLQAAIERGIQLKERLIARIARLRMGKA